MKYFLFTFIIFLITRGKMGIHASRGGGMLRARVGFSPGQNFINNFLLVLC
jgi:hypothetical protein